MTTALHEYMQNTWGVMEYLKKALFEHWKRYIDDDEKPSNPKADAEAELLLDGVVSALRTAGDRAEGRRFTGQFRAAFKGRRTPAQKKEFTNFMFGIMVEEFKVTEADTMKIVYDGSEAKKKLYGHDSDDGWYFKYGFLDPFLTKLGSGGRVLRL